MEKFKTYGKGFLVASAVVAVGLVFLLARIGLPVLLALPLAVVAAVPATFAIGVFGFKAWLFSDDDFGSDSHDRERYERKAQMREGQAFLERAKRRQ